MPDISLSRMKDDGTLFLKGICMGAADVVPGVSGGTMALILGIYQRLIEAIKSFDLDWLKSIFRIDLKTVFTRPHFDFLIPLIIGITFSLFFFTRVVPLPELLHTHPEPVYGLFFGLVTGSIVMLIHEIKCNGVDYFFIVAGTIAGFLAFNLVPVETPEAAWFIFLSGALAICAMILPGISGSFILLMLKKYSYIFNAIGYLKFSVLIPFALGAAAGLILFSRFLSWLLHQHYRPTMLTIIGILIASLWVIWPYQARVFQVTGNEQQMISTTPYLPDVMTTAILPSAGMMLAGIVLVVVIHFFARGKTDTGE